MKKSDVNITFNEKQIQINQKFGKNFIIDWKEITSIKVFKRDLLTVDEICMELNISDGKSLEINEEMTGWDELVKNITDYLDYCIPFEEWYPKVAHPPFETELKEIYSSKKHAL